MIPPDRWIHVKALFAAAVDCTPEERMAFLAAACRNDAPLREEVEALLRADAHATGFIEIPAVVLPASSAGVTLDDANVPSLRTGDCLGPYEIVEFIGAGGMAEVYKGRDRRLERHVALKVLVGGDIQDSAALERFDREARAASALNHPNIVTIHDIGRAQSDRASVAYIAMELVEGRTLRSLLGEGALAVGQLLDISVQIADALAAAHSKGIVHRDLKPENIMIGPEGRAKILDFGLARVEIAAAPGGRPVVTETADRVTQAGVTQAGVLVGTVAYMSPQQANGEALDFRSDQFSFGAMLYEMATGTHPFQRATTEEMLAAIIGEDPEPIRRVVPELPEPLQWIVTRCLAKKVEDRYASTVDLAHELAIVREHLERPRPDYPETARAHNLPAQRTPLVGRDKELSAIRALVLRVQPLNLRPDHPQRFHRLECGCADLVIGHFAGARYLSLNHELWHVRWRPLYEWPGKRSR
jgi:eukaryotic-like serine/threonine-protein kinase